MIAFNSLPKKASNNIFQKDVNAQIQENNQKNEKIAEELQSDDDEDNLCHKIKKIKQQDVDNDEEEEEENDTEEDDGEEESDNIEDEEEYPEEDEEQYPEEDEEDQKNQQRSSNIEQIDNLIQNNNNQQINQQQVIKNKNNNNLEEKKIETQDSVQPSDYQIVFHENEEGEEYDENMIQDDFDVICKKLNFESQQISSQQIQGQINKLNKKNINKVRQDKFQQDLDKLQQQQIQSSSQQKIMKLQQANCSNNNQILQKIKEEKQIEEYEQDLDNFNKSLNDLIAELPTYENKQNRQSQILLNNENGLQMQQNDNKKEFLNNINCQDNVQLQQKQDQIINNSKYFNDQNTSNIADAFNNQLQQQQQQQKIKEFQDFQQQANEDSIIQQTLGLKKQGQNPIKLQQEWSEKQLQIEYLKEKFDNDQTNQPECNMLVIPTNQEQQLYLVKKDGASIGRNTTNLIHLVDESVSRFHAQIESRNQKFYLRDLESMTGTFIKIQEKFMIEEGHIFELGSVKLQIKEINLNKDKPSTILIHKFEVLRTIIDFSQQQIYEQDTLSEFTFTMSNGERKGIGRNPLNQIISDDVNLSQNHAQISLINNIFYIEDLASLNGTWIRLSDIKIQSELFELNSGDIFRIGPQQQYRVQMNSLFLKQYLRENYLKQQQNPDPCIICMENDKTALYMPCRHNCCCHRCSLTLIMCPICKVHIDEMIRIFKT